MDFLTKLKKNNNREWFHANKKTYEKFVKNPFQQFIEELVFRIQEFDTELSLDPKKAIFRVNRDIRFSKDKTPYKTYISASIKNGGRTSPNTVGYYLSVAPDNVYIGAGAYHIDKKGLYNLRSKIVNSLDEFNKLIEEKSFKEVFEEVYGDKNKRLPKEFQEAAEKQPLVANKAFHYSVKLSPKEILEKDILEKITNYFKITFDLNRFIQDGING